MCHLYTWVGHWSVLDELETRAEWGFKQDVQKDPKKELYSGMSKASVLGHAILKDADVHIEVSQILL